MSSQAFIRVRIPITNDTPSFFNDLFDRYLYSMIAMFLAHNSSTSLLFQFSFSEHARDNDFTVSVGYSVTCHSFPGLLWMACGAHGVNMLDRTGMSCRLTACGYLKTLSLGGY
jgi:hypothetical protein